MADKGRNLVCFNECLVVEAVLAFLLHVSEAFFNLSHSGNINIGVCVIKMDTAGRSSGLYLFFSKLLQLWLGGKGLPRKCSRQER